MNRPALISALVLAACSSPRAPRQEGCVPPVASPSNPTVAVQHQPAAIEFLAGTECDPPTSIEASVLGPDNQLIASMAVQDAYIATVKFTPQVPGPHHISMRFQPNRGLGQFDVEVAIDRTATPALELDDFPLGYPLDVTDAGWLFSYEADYAIYTTAGGKASLVQHLDPGPATAVSGDVLWLGAPLARWVPGTLIDGGPGMVRSPDVALPVDAVALYATPTDAVVQLADGGLGKARVLDGGLDWVDYGWPFGVTLGIQRVGDQLMSIESGRDCVFELADAGLDCVALTPPLELTVLGSNAGGFWLANRQSVTWHGPGHALGPVYTFPAGLDLVRYAPRDATTPVIGRDVQFTAVVDQGAIHLEYWGSPVAATPATASSSSIDKKLRVFKR